MLILDNYLAILSEISIIMVSIIQPIEENKNNNI